MIPGVLAGLVVLVATGCGASITPPPTATVNHFLSAFFKGHLGQAAGLMPGGTREEQALTRYRPEVKALLVNRPPFSPLTALHWTTHCSGLTCTVDFSSFNTYSVTPFRVHLQTAGTHARVPISALQTWISTIGHAP